MAAVTYYMHIRASDDLIGEVSLTDDWPNPDVTMVVRSASFSSDSGDSPDVETPLGRPLALGTYDGVTYTPPADVTKPYIKLTWSGTGELNGSIYELDEGETATLTLQKWDENADQAISSGGEEYWICPNGANSGADVGKVTLNGSGQAVVNFTANANEKGLVDILIVPVNPSSPPAKESGKLGLV